MKFAFKFLPQVVVILFASIISCSKNEPPNENGCFAVNVGPCIAYGLIANDPVEAGNFLIGSWEWNSSYYDSTIPFHDEISPFPDHCNITLQFNNDMTFEVTVGNGQKESGNYIIDEEDVTLSDQMAIYYGPNYVHQFKMHITLSPNPVISLSGPSTIQSVFLSGVLSVSQGCLTISHWSRDSHGYERNTGSKFVKK